jgi:imidazole glycerol-phosphate synthase subunit HisH
MNTLPRLAVIDYGMGNLRSVIKAWEHEGAQIQMVSSPSAIGNADALILPGVGALGDCVKTLEHTGLGDSIRDWIAQDKPFFGICLGLQALFEKSEEGDIAGLGIIPGRVRRFKSHSGLKIPHMGWNKAVFYQETPVNKGLNMEGEWFYFVHSYYVVPENPNIIWCKTEYGNHFVSGIKMGNCFATQFHPEKSQSKGLKIYRNFIEWIKN